MPVMNLAACFEDGAAAGPHNRLLDRFDWAGSGVAIPYVIFMTGRCGSTLLTHLLRETGLCGNPDEFFNEAVIGPLRERLGVGGFADYFRAVVAHSASNRRFGIEIDPFRCERLRELMDFTGVFPRDTAVFFWMTRRDIVGQAWSYAKAKKTGHWHLYTDGAAPAGTPPDAPIADHEWWSEILLMLRAEQLMERFFAAAGIEPHRLDYEMLVTDRRRTVIAVLQALSCSPDAIAQRLDRLDDATRRHDYADWHTALIRFSDTYRAELQQIARSRPTLDVYRLWLDLKERHALPL